MQNRECYSHFTIHIQWPETEVSSASPSEAADEQKQDEGEQLQKIDEADEAEATAEEAVEEAAAVEEEATEEEENAAETAENTEASATNLTGASATNVTGTSATNLTAEGENEAETDQDGGEEDDDDMAKSVITYSESVAKSIKSVLTQKSARTSASSGKYSEFLLLLSFQNMYIFSTYESAIIKMAEFFGPVNMVDHS